MWIGAGNSPSRRIDQMVTLDKGTIRFTAGHNKMGSRGAAAFAGSGVDRDFKGMAQPQ